MSERTDWLPSRADRAALAGERLEPAEPDQLLTADDLAARWRVRREMIYRLAREGDLPTVRLGPRYVRFSLSAIAEFEKNGGTESKE
jgi:excisionase family DNA binding protein